MESGGQRLKRLRERLGLTVRQVQKLSSELASRHDDPNYFVDKARLSDFEAKGILPNIYKLHALAVIYHRSMAELLGFYGIDADRLPQLVSETPLPRTHVGGPLNISQVRVPVEIEPTFDLRLTGELSRLITKWGTVPLAFLAPFEHSSAMYGYIGTDDWTMYPLLLPGSFVIINQANRRIESGPWASEYQRPIYFVETRGLTVCGWCALEGANLVVQPHPLSPGHLRIYKIADTEIIGQVAAVAMRLDQKIRLSPRSSSQVQTTTSQGA